MATKRDESIHNPDLSHCQCGLTIPTYQHFDKKTADLKISFKSPGEACKKYESQTGRRCSKVTSGSTSCNKTDDTITYLLHSYKFSCFEKLRDYFVSDDPDVESSPGQKPIRRLVIEKGFLTPAMFEKVVEWAYTGRYTFPPTNKRSSEFTTEERLDKKLAGVGILLSCPQLLELTIKRMRARMEAKNQELDDSELRNVMATERKAKGKEKMCKMTRMPVDD